MTSRPGEPGPMRTGSTPWLGRAACAFVVLVSAYLALLVWFRMDSRAGYEPSFRCADWFGRAIGPHLPAVPFKFGEGIGPGTGDVELAHPAAALRHALMEPIDPIQRMPDGLANSLLGTFLLPAFAYLAGYHVLVVMFWQAGRSQIASWRYPHRLISHPSLDSVLSHAALSALLAIPALACFQFLRAFWSAAYLSNGTLYTNIFGHVRSIQALTGLAMVGLCWQLFAIRVAGRFTAWPRCLYHSVHGSCAACGYPSGGTMVAACPECGHAIRDPVRGEPPWSFGTTLGVLIVLMILFAFTPLLMSWWSLIV